MTTATFPDVDDATPEQEVVESEVSAEQADAEGAEAAAQLQAESDLRDFESVATSAASEADPTTGTLATAQLEPVKIAYRTMSGGAKIKNRAKAFIVDQMRKALNEVPNGGPVTAAVAWNVIQGAVLEAAPSAGKEPAEKASPSKIYADKVMAHRIALDLIEDEVNQPEGVEENWEDEIQDGDDSETAQVYLDWVNSDEETRGDEPDVSKVVRAAVKLALAKGPRAAGRPAGTRGPRRVLQNHIDSAFAGLDSGDFLTVAEICAAHSDEYGDDSPTTQAVTLRLFPADGRESTLKGVTPAENADGEQGAAKN